MTTPSHHSSEVNGSAFSPAPSSPSLSSKVDKFLLLDALLSFLHSAVSIFIVINKTVWKRKVPIYGDYKNKINKEGEITYFS